jgi:hypothetical protein
MPESLYQTESSVFKKIQSSMFDTIDAMIDAVIRANLF